jgi:hypothetical protein
MADQAIQITVTATGLIRGHELSGSATVALRGELLELVTRSERHALPLAALDGARILESGALELALDGADAVVLYAGINGSASLKALGDELVKRACAIPEFTRALRGLGSRHAGPGAEHDRFFRPLLEARRGAERAARADGARLAFDAASLRAAFNRRLREMAHERYPHDPPERRALEAEATDVAAPLYQAIISLDFAQRALDAAADIERIARWREWTGALQRVFAQADDVWLALRPVFAAPAARTSPWRRIFRGRAPEPDA